MELVMEHLAVSPKMYKFDPQQERSMLSFLEDRDRATLVLPIGSPNDLILTPDNVTARGYRYTHLALNQLCRLMCTGLAQLLPDVAGVWRKLTDDSRDFSSSIALDIFNKLVRLRFERSLQSLQMV